MAVKKIGKAKAEPENGQWGVEIKPEKFTMNPRIVEGRPDYKLVQRAYSKFASRYIPTTRRPTLRAEYMAERSKLKNELDQLVKQVYVEVLEDSFSCPVVLRKEKDSHHNGDWRYCLYQGIIYQFDRPGYLEDEMVQQITALQPPAA